MIEGVRLVRLNPFVDHRGTLTTLMDDAEFWSEPVVHAYRITVRPGRIKGWGMHRLQTDRYFVCGGRLRVVLYDGRNDSATHESIDEFGFDETTPALLAIPPGVWHAVQNTDGSDAMIVNFPTRRHDAESPGQVSDRSRFRRDSLRPWALRDF